MSFNQDAVCGLTPRCVLRASRRAGHSVFHDLGGCVLGTVSGFLTLTFSQATRMKSAPMVP